MNLRQKSVRGSVVLTLGELVVHGGGFIRNVILARLLTKADFGIAATLAMVINLLEFSGKLGIARFVIRDPEGDEPEFLATAHLVQALAAGLSAALIAAAAWPMARLFGIGEHFTGLLALAVVPLLQGVGHLDTRRYERELRFGPSTMVDAIPQLGITLLAWPVGVWFGDYRAVLLLLVVKAVLSCVGSHWLAEQPYRWRCRRDYVTRMVRFGWPLIVNGLLMFVVLRGDQFLVATFYSMEDLGPYAAAAALTLAPTFFFTRVFASVMLPVMAKVQNDAAAFVRRYRLVVGLIGAFAASYAAGVMLCAEALMSGVFGSKYAGAGIILAWLTAANALRILRLAPAIAAIARGDSVNQMVSNLSGLVALLPALAVALAGQPVWMVACSGLVGETVACIVSFHRLERQHQVPLVRNVQPVALVAAVLLLAGWGGHWGVQQLTPLASVSVAALGAMVAGATVVLVLEDPRQEAGRFWRRLRSVGWRRLPSFLRGTDAPGKPAAT